MNEATSKAWVAASVRALRSTFAQRMSAHDGGFADRERAALAVANELVRDWTEAELCRIAKSYGDEVVVDGSRYRRHTSGRRRYHSLCGPMHVKRDTYRLVGVHNGRTIVPLELDAGITNNATPALSSSVLQAFAMMPLRHYQDEMRLAHRTVPARSTLERIAKRSATELEHDLPIIEPALREQQERPSNAASVSIGIDRTTIPMAEPTGLLPAYWNPSRRVAPPVTVAYRMAYVATVALNDANGNAIKTTRFAATADEGPVAMMERVGAEVQHTLRLSPALPVICVQDGAPELWNLVEQWFADFGIDIEMRLIDRYHVEERLAALATLFESREEQRARLLTRWRVALDKSDRAMKKICEQIMDRAYFPAVCPDVPDPTDPWYADAIEGWEDDREPRFDANTTRIVDGHLTYLRGNEEARRMRYATARARGYPIGSGVTEGACKSVIACRLKRSGQRWSPRGAAACLRLRTLHLNGQLERAINFHLDLRAGGAASA